MINMVYALEETDRNVLLASRIDRQRYPQLRQPEVKSFQKLKDRFGQSAVTMQSRHYGLVLGSLAFIIINNNAEAGPAARRLAREIYPEVEPENDANQSQVCVVGDVVYDVDELVPAEQPCLKCRCQPPGIQCEATRCPSKKPGCKTVHRPNQCCPDYQCECEYNGKLYSNGERLETSPGKECKVCYCRGGEIKCTDVSCYVRNDCEGKQVAGQCCPKYDHCPTRDSMEKLQSNNSSSTTTASVSESEDSSTTPSEILLDKNPENNKIQIDNAIPSDFDQITQGNSLQSPRITIQEIIPSIKEIPITPDPKIEVNRRTSDKLSLEEDKITESSDIAEETSNDLITDSDAESSEIAEVIQNPPPVIRIGENLLFLKRNELVHEKDASSTPASIITLVGAEGLQRGGVEEYIDNITNPEIFVVTSEKPIPTTKFEDNDLSSASSSHILSLVKKKKKPTVTPLSTTILPSTQTISPGYSSSSIDAVTQSLDTTTMGTTESAALSTWNSVESSTILPENNTMFVAEVSEDSKNISTITDTFNSTVMTTSDDQLKSDTIVEQNPSYPTLPDMITRYNEEEWTKIETDKDSNETSLDKKYRKESKILQEILEVRNNKTVPSNVTHTEWLKIGKMNNDDDDFVPLINLGAALPLDILNAPAESDEPDNGEISDEDIVDQNQTVNVSTTTFDVDLSETTEASLNSSIEIITGDAENIDSGKPENLTELASVDTFRSVETMENSQEYSGEKTTAKSQSDTFSASQENASIEEGKKDLEANDMLFVKEYTIDLSNDEERKESDGRRNSNNTTNNDNIDDVELINVADIEKNNSYPAEIPERLPIPEKFVTTATKIIGKRENTLQAEDDAVFSQLNEELGLGSTERPKTSEEENIEAQRIFQELLEETRTPKPDKPTGERNNETEALEKVSQALAKLVLGGSQPLDTGVLSVLRDFFSSQYRAYNSKSP